jgi:cardiolipin synthase
MAVAGFSDGLDGLLAKRYGWQTRLGSLLDPLADKMLLVSCFVTLGWLGDIPLWLVATVVARDVVILSGALAYHFLLEKVSGEPTIISKLNTLVQILLVILVIFDHAIGGVPQWLLNSLIWFVLGTTVLSGVQYVVAWSGKAVQKARENRG